MGSTWDAVIDMFAERNIPIRTIERASGIIATEQLSVGPEGKVWPDCGRSFSGTVLPNYAIYNLLVRGDSSSSRVKATVRRSLTSKTSGSPLSARPRTCGSADSRSRQGNGPNAPPAPPAA